MLVRDPAGDDPRQSQEEKHKLGRASSKFKDPPRIMQSDDYFARKFKAINGNMGPTTSLTASSSNESGGPANGTPAMPKMGVRARVSLLHSPTLMSIHDHRKNYSLD